MKNIKKINQIFVVALLIITNASAQETIKPIENHLTDGYCEFPNTYYKDTNGKLQNLVGTWVYNNGMDYFKITFYKMKITENEKYNVHGDVLFSKFLYKKNNVIIYDNYGTNSYNLSDGPVNMKTSKIESSFVKDSSISFVYYEPSTNDCHRRRVGRLKITYINNSSPQLQWIRTTDEHYFRDMPCDNGVEPDNSDFVIPANMVLNKIF